MYSVGDIEDGVCAKDSYIDCCVGSPTMLMKFLQTIVQEWGLQSSGALSYMQAISDLCDFRKCHGVDDSTLRLFAVTEVYLRRTKSTLYRKKNIEYSRNLSLESLIAKGSWATLEEVEKVIPHHAAKYEKIFQKATTSTNSPLTVSELAFATRFIITFLMLRVKCTRPMSLQYLTLEMIETATKDDGFVDQTQFKTQGQYVFDSLKFSNDALDVVNTYINRIRPLCNPKCDYVILTTNGKQYTAFCNAMSILTYEAIGKHITPTRYRAIVETESSVRLDKEKQAIISHDQKHSSTIAKRCYQKKLSREVAEGGVSAMKELVGDNREAHTGVLANALREVNVTSNDSVMDNDHQTPSTSKHNEQEKVNETSSSSPGSEHDNDLPAPILIDDTTSFPDKKSEEDSTAKIIESDDIEVKKEELEGGKKFLAFITEEDENLKAGIEKHAKSKRKWSDILNDDAFKFQEGRTRDSLRMRATTLGLEQRKPKRNRKSK